MKKFFVTTVVLFVCAFSLFAQNNLQPLATVKLNKSETITLGQLKSRVDLYQRQTGTTLTFEQKKEILNAMIDEKLVVQSAAKAGITLTDAQVNEYYLNYLAQMVGKQVTENEFADMVKTETGKTYEVFMKEQTGMTVAEYKKYLKEQMIANQYILSLKEKEVNAVTVSDDEVRNFYEINKTSFVQSDTLKMLLVIAQKNGDPSAAKTRATSLNSDLKAKKTTAEKIKQGTGSGYDAGDFYVAKNATAAAQLGMDYNSLLEMFKKDKGFISEVTETDTDFQFWQILEKHNAKMLGLSDVVQPGTSVTVYEYIKENLKNQKQSQILATGVSELSKSLRTDTKSFKIEKKDDALEKLLTW